MPDNDDRASTAVNDRGYMPRLVEERRLQAADVGRRPTLPERSAAPI
jgi:hypothetical protein